MSAFSLSDKILTKITDFAIDNLNKVLPGQQLRDLIGAFHSKAEYRAALKNALQRAVQRFNAQHTDTEVVAALEQEKFWELPGVQAVLREVITRPSSYLEPERAQLIQAFAEAVPNVSSAQMYDALQFFSKCLADEVLNIPQLAPIYSAQIHKVSLDQGQQIVEAVVGMRNDSRNLLETLTSQQTKPALPSGATQPAPALPKNNLPRPDYSVFVGREQEKAKVIERLSPKKQNGVITIDGVGGVGKSALALEAAYYFVNNYPTLPEAERFEAIIWTSAKQKVLTADGIRSRPQILRNLEDIYTAISITLGHENIIRAKAEEQAALVTAALSERRTLLIVDNLETVDDENLLEFLQELPLTAKAIVTTRHRIDVAYPVRLFGLPEKDGLALIQGECIEKNVSINPDDAKELYKRTGGLPLAIVWSVGLLGCSHSVKSVLAKLGSPASDIVKFCFEASVEAIRGDTAENQNAYKLLLALSLFAKDATREALGYVADFGEDEISRDDALVTLEKLSLINKSGNRFSLLPLTKVFAAGELEKEHTLKNELLENWDRFFLGIVSNTKAQTYQELTQLEVEIPNMLGFMNQCVTNDNIDDLATFLLKNTALFWFRGYWLERGYYLRIAYERLITKVGSKKIIAMLAYRLAEISQYRGEMAVAETLRLQALAIFEDVKDFKHIRDLCRDLANLYLEIGDIDKARAYINKAYQATAYIELSERSIFRLKLGDAQIEMAQRNFDRADTLLRESIEYQEKTGDTESSNVTICYTLLARIEATKGNYVEAQTKLDRALELANITQVKQNLALVSQSFAVLKEATSEKGEALEYAYAALRLYKELGMKLRIAETEEIIVRCEKMP